MASTSAFVRKLRQGYARFGSHDARFNRKRFAAGLYHYRDTYLYVNKGVGFGFRFRYGVRPEVTVLSLRPR